MSLIDFDPKVTSPAVAAANALGALPASTPVVGTGATGLPVATATTGTGSVVLAGGATLTTATVNELTTTKITALSGAPVPTRVACPAFAEGAASIALASTKSTECVIEAARTLGAPSTLTLATTSMVAGELYMVTCYALSLGQVLTVASAGITLATFAASLTVPKQHSFFFDGVVLFYDTSAWV